MKRLFTQFSFPGGVPSHASAECPGSIHEGGELGYSLSHAFGAVFDNPSLTVACVIGDGEAETGPLATAWHSNKFLNPASDGAVLPILHLNGYKIANPTVLARISREELDQLLHGCGWEPHYVEGHEPMPMHAAMAAALDTVDRAHRRDSTQRPIRRRRRGAGRRAPAMADDRAHLAQGLDRVRKSSTASKSKARSGRIRCRSPIRPRIPRICAQLEQWLRSYRPQELFDERGRSSPSSGRSRRKASGAWERIRSRMAGSSCAICACRILPTTRSKSPTRESAVSARPHVLGRYLRDVVSMNAESRNFRIFGPDETMSNGLEAVFEATPRQWEAATIATR